MKRPFPPALAHEHISRSCHSQPCWVRAGHHPSSARDLGWCWVSGLRVLTRASLSWLPLCGDVLGPAANCCPAPGAVPAPCQTLTALWALRVVFKMKPNRESSCLCAAQSGASSDTGSFLYGQMVMSLQSAVQNDSILILLSHQNFNCVTDMKTGEVGMLCPQEKRMLLAHGPEYPRNCVSSHFLE